MTEVSSEKKQTKTPSKCVFIKRINNERESYARLEMGM